MKVAEYISLFFATLGIFLSITVNEMASDKTADKLQYHAEIYNIICSSGLVFSIYIRYDI